MPLMPGMEKCERFVLPSTQRLDSNATPTTPETDWAWVVIDIAPMRAGDMVNLDDRMASGGQGLRMVTDRIKEWNYQDAEGGILPITFENVSKLNIDDFHFLNDKLLPESVGLTNEEKKALPPTSPASETVGQPLVVDQ